MRISDWSSDVCSSDLVGGSCKTLIGGSRMSQFNGSLEAVKVQYENKVCTITMARPEKNNGLDLQMRKELWAIFAALKEDNETQVVVLTGQGTHFSYGTFDPASRSATDKDTIVRMVLEGNMLIDDLENLQIGRAHV